MTTINKKYLLIIGGLLGILFSVYDSSVSYSGTAPLDDDFGIEIISWNFFLMKTLVYVLIGILVGLIISKLIKIFTNRNVQNKYSLLFKKPR
ncbi:hypothetical protein AR687_17225 [Flavobacteriaceae bacterium CRH]|nr:hypothetical protein AR687_17225 [Flavobacteriaceae bacterium CRH]